MEVHIVIYRWCANDDEGTDIIGVYTDKTRACSELHAHMRAVEQRVRQYYGDDRFHEDFAMDEQTYISFGFYGEGLGLDCVWIGQVETMPVE